MPDFLHPNRGWFLGAAGMVAAYILDQIDAPLWLAVLTLGLLLASAALWPWIEKHGYQRWFWTSLGLYTMVATGIAVSTGQTDGDRNADPPVRISLKCERVPGFPRLESSGIVRQFYLAPTGGGFISTERRSDDGAFKWSKQPRTCFRCEMVNDGSVPIFNVVVQFQTTFQEAIATGESSYRSGSTTSEFPAALTAARIDSGPDMAFAFYILNASNQFLRVSRPSSASFEIADNGRITATMITSGDEMIFPPEFALKP